MFRLEEALQQPHIRMEDLTEKLRAHGHVHLSGTAAGALCYAVTRLRALLKRPVMIWTPSVEQAQRFTSNIEFYRTDKNDEVLLYAGYEVSPFVDIAIDRNTEMDRLGVLHRFTQTESWGYAIAPLTAAIQRVPPKGIFSKFAKLYAVGQKIDAQHFEQTVRTCGFLHAAEVEDPGTYHVRTRLIDFFVPTMDVPVRIEHDDAKVVSIKTFDAITQTTLTDIDNVELFPIRDHVFLPDEKETIHRKLRALCDHHNHPSAKSKTLIDQAFGHRTLPLHRQLLPVFYDKLDSIFDYLAPHEPLHVICDPNSIEADLDHTLNVWLEDFEAIEATSSPHEPITRYALSDEEISERLKSSSILIAHPLAVLGKDEEDVPVTALHWLGRATEPERIAAWDHATLVRTLGQKRKEKGLSLENQLEPLTAAITSWVSEGLRVSLVTKSLSQSERLRHLLKELSQHITLVEGGLRDGVLLPHSALAFLTEEEIFGAQNLKRTKSGRRNQAQAWLEDLRELKPGDHVVHVEHGIGRYIGLERKELQRSKLEELQGIKALAVETLVIAYSGGDRLYLPVTRLNQIHKFQGAEAAKVKIDRLGGQTFARTKARVKQAVRQMADELMRLYAERAARSRPPLPPAGLAYEAFEATFPYEETPDQAQAIEDVLSDLARDRPMDRLVCGDVGFGKTEVAMRAAFRMAYEGRQVAVLCPTTVLAEQHYRTFSARFSDYPIHVGVLSRFVDKARQAETLAQLKNGACDIVIGTHRLLSADVHFKELGLLVVDEEQRFGVAHKERIKQLKNTVDVLTLSATPIPRTLHMALGGVRDLSLIATAPVDRRAVKTYITRWDPHVLKRAIEDELDRGGQIFFVYNRIEGLYERAQKLQELVPRARIVVAHGQLTEAALDKAMTDFVAGQYDILCATTIIESGLDIPRANTMLIDRADAFGLAQLYQLRGRVGRSKPRAACYLISKALDQITDDARARLEALERFTELGSGFHIASLDMELRGTGDVLGAEQSGTAALVGIEMFIHMLEEAVAELRGEPQAPKIDPDVKVDIEHSLPESYIEDVGVRLSLYKRMATSESSEAVEEIGLELLDRFGPTPMEVENLIRVMALKANLRSYGILGCEGLGRRVTLHLNQDSKVNVEKITKLIAQPKSAWKLTPDMKLTYFGTLDEGGDSLERIDRVLREITLKLEGLNMNSQGGLY